MSQGLPDHVYSVLIGIAEDTVVLPNSAVAEVAGQETLKLRDQAPAWWLGDMEWRGRKLPVLSLEAFLGREPPAVERRCRLVIINALGNSLESGQYAIFSQAYPLLVTLNETAIRAAARNAKEEEHYVLARVEFANRAALIPNLTALEESLQQALSTARV